MTPKLSPAARLLLPLCSVGLLAAGCLDSASAPTAAQVHPLSDDQQAFFKEHGYVVLRGFASQQVSAAWLAAAQDGLARAAAPVELETDVGYAGAPLSREA